MHTGRRVQHIRTKQALSNRTRSRCGLRLIAGLTVKEVAASLAKQPGAVKALHRRGLAALRRRMANEPPEP